MCQMLMKAIATADGGNAQGGSALKELRNVIRHPDPSWAPSSAQEIANRLLCTCYMGTTNSSVETRSRAAQLAREIGVSLTLFAAFFLLLVILMHCSNVRVRGHIIGHARNNR